MMNLDSLFWIAGILVESIVVGLLFYRRVWQRFPFFAALCTWDLLSAIGNYFVLHYSSPGSYLTTYLAEIAIASFLEISVLVELAWSVLRPIRSKLPRRTLWVLVFLILACGVAIWPISGMHRLTQMPEESYLLAHLEQTVSILRVLFFLMLAGSSQLLSIGWRDRELQVATGLGFYSLASLGVAMLRSHQATISQYSDLNQFVVGAYITSMLYWAFSFAQSEAPRREFTPQMQSFLLAVAGAARADRIALAQSTNSDAHSRHDL